MGVGLMLMERKLDELGVMKRRHRVVEALDHLMMMKRLDTK